MYTIKQLAQLAKLSKSQIFYLINHNHIPKPTHQKGVFPLSPFYYTEAEIQTVLKKIEELKRTPRV